MEIKGKFCKDCKIFTDELEPDALSLVYSFTNHPEFEDSKIRIMPDVHMGKDIVIGFTAPLKNSVNPNHIGGDIGCSVKTSIIDLPINSEDYPNIERGIRNLIRFGEKSQETTVYDVNNLYKFLQTAMDYAHTVWPEMIDRIKVNEREVSKFLERIGMKEDKFYHDLGSVGGGNHFIEIGKTPENNYAWTTHTGSRSLGQGVWQYWNKQATKPENTSTSGYLTGNAMKEYITDVVFTQIYAKFNHRIIHNLIRKVFLDITKKFFGYTEEIFTEHNYIDWFSKMIRKGSVSAEKDRLLIIPFNMRDGLAICKGKGNEDWNNSAPHGAGRQLSRSDAKELLDMETFKKSMEGIYTTCVKKSVLDESPEAYKDYKKICDLIKPTVDIMYFIKPVINLKNK